MEFGVVDALIAQGAVVLLLGFLLFASADQAGSWRAGVLFSRLGWGAMVLAASSWVTAAWVAALT